MSEKDNRYIQHRENGREERHDGHKQHEQRDYGHIHERVEETSSTKNPPKER